MYAYINEKKERIVKKDELLTIKLKTLLLYFIKKFEIIRYIFIKTAIANETKPISELINIFYSNSLNSLI